MTDGTDEEPDLPDQRWVTMETEHESPGFGGYEAWGYCACGSQVDGESFTDGDQLDCSACGRVYRVRFEQIEGATRKHPMCPVCHVGMTKASGYWCPECNVDIVSAFVDTYDDVLREYQIREWLLMLQESCSRMGSDWHTHDSPYTIHHCPRCCSNCSCDCTTPNCHCGSMGEGLPNPRFDYDDRARLYRQLRRTMGEDGRFDCEAERHARTLEEVEDEMSERLDGAGLSDE